jgi:tetratricopeptide (TPR) repeat protein
MDAKSPELSRILNRFALHHLHFRRYDEARTLLEEADRIDRHRNHGHHSTHAYTLSNLALLALAENRYDDAQRFLEKGRKIMEPSPYHRDILGRLYYVQAALLSARREYASAADFLQRAIAIHRSYIDPRISEKSPDLFSWTKSKTIRMYTELASLYKALDRQDLADAAYREILHYRRIFEPLYPHGMLETVITSTIYDSRWSLPKRLRHYFPNDTQVIWSTLYVYNLRPNTIVRVTWSYRLDPKSKWKPYYETSYRVSGSQSIPVGLRAPAGGFPPGEYRVIYQIPKSLKRVGFFIVLPDSGRESQPDKIPNHSKETS